MRYKIILFVVILAGIFGQNSFCQKALPKLKNVSYKCGEKLTFRVHYGVIDAGECTLEIKPTLEKIGPRNCYHVVGIGKSLGAFNWFFKVEDRYETTIDAEALTPWIFLRRVDEGGYKINQNYSFNPYKNTVSTGRETVTVPDSIQDLLSAFYFARTFDFSKIKEGDLFEVKIYLDEKLYPMAIKFVGRETISTRLGKFPCLRFQPQLIKGRIFKDQVGMNLWISDDLNHIPIRLESELLIGSIKIDLSNYSGLANIINKVME